MRSSARPRATSLGWQSTGAGIPPAMQARIRAVTADSGAATPGEAIVWWRDLLGRFTSAEWLRDEASPTARTLEWLIRPAKGGLRSNVAKLLAGDYGQPGGRGGGDDADRKWAEVVRQIRTVEAGKRKAPDSRTAAVVRALGDFAGIGSMPEAAARKAFLSAYREAS